MKIGITGINTKLYAASTASFGHNNNFEISKNISSNEFPKSNNSYIKPAAIARNELAATRQSRLNPISTEEEYNTLLEEIFKYKDNYNSNMLRPPFIKQWGYETVDSGLKGLIAYCGDEDKSKLINCWLTARPIPENTPVTDEQIVKIISVLEYSLKKLDEKFGKYQGIVYRNGFFNPVTDKQFYSTSANPINAVKHANVYIPAENNPYSIIKVKNGHNINAFQKHANSFISRRFSQTENEILIDRNSKFRIIPEKEYTEKDKQLKAILLTQAVRKDEDITQRDIDNTLKQYSDLLKYISVWEEI